MSSSSSARGDYAQLGGGLAFAVLMLDAIAQTTGVCLLIAGASTSKTVQERDRWDNAAVGPTLRITPTGLAMMF